MIALQFTEDEHRVILQRQAKVLEAVTIILELRNFRMVPGRHVLAPDLTGVLDIADEQAPPSPSPPPGN